MVSHKAAVKLGPADSWDASEEQAEKRPDYSISLEKKTPLRQGTGFWAPLTNIQVAQVSYRSGGTRHLLKEKEGREGNLQLECTENGAERWERGRSRGQLTSSLAWNKYSFPSCKLLGEKETSGQS